ncbi:hypothetical protein KUTeg_001534 [Tegillarca granosa]|uniref:Chitin-binding type-4 domain-containing protein n=1 Tax=Tegillarca granosa TaxID=220873 RepID=A0ABQ9FVC9_TEGGR|nr:hypothetical protein KUTeg_001534 [Tegillarca granosa]
MPELAISGHGRLWDPPSRSSMWRQGYSTPHNYNDNQLNCGGFANQWGTNRGKCGICGDPYSGKRDNEAGGKYATGIITRQYRAGDVIDVDIQITANHKGWSEFRLCPNNDVNKPATQECLDKHLLQLADGSGTRFQLSTEVGHFKIKLKLPDGLTCTQCVLQWKWHAGNSWGFDRVNNRGCIGCGAQEEFYGCADVAIRGDGNESQQTAKVLNVQTTLKPTTYKLTTTTTTTHKPTTSTTTRKLTTTTTTTTPKPTTTTTTQKSTTKTTTPRPTTTTTQKFTTSPTTVRLITSSPSSTKSAQPWSNNGSPVKQNIGNKCRGAGAYRAVPGMVWWCSINCGRGYCPKTHCVCT